MDTLAHSDETIEDLQLDGLKLLQRKKGFRFGLDAVVLADFAHLLPKAAVVDLCSGGGIISLLLCHHYHPTRVDAIELQSAYADMAARSAALNGLSDTLSVYCRDGKDAPDFLPNGYYDAVVCNPPYKKVGTGISSPSDELSLAREERALSFADVAEASSKLLKYGGKLYLVHRPERLVEILDQLHSKRLEPKRLRFVANTADSRPSLFLLEAVNGAKPGLFTEAQLNVYNAQGEETVETRRIYRRKTED